MSSFLQESGCYTYCACDLVYIKHLLRVMFALVLVYVLMKNYMPYIYLLVVAFQKGNGISC